MVGLGFPTTFTTPSEAALAAKSTGSPQPRIHFLIVDVKRACVLTTGSMSVMTILHQSSLPHLEQASKAAAGAGASA
jgi:hypothetical protein